MNKSRHIAPEDALPRFAVILIALALAACARQDPVLGFEASQAKLTQHRKAYEWLAAELRTCGLEYLAATGPVGDRCAGKFDAKTLQSAMITLRIKEAHIDEDEVRLMTGADRTHGQSMAVPVASWMIHTRYPEPARAEPLTAAPSHWFYAAHD